MIVVTGLVGHGGGEQAHKAAWFTHSRANRVVNTLYGD